MSVRRLLTVAIILVCVLVLMPDSAVAQLMGNRTAPAESAMPGWLPGPLRDLLAWAVVQQAEFSRALRGAVSDYRDGHSMVALYSLVGLSFLYGVFHAIGPGHGKAVVASYFMARDSQLRRGIALGCLIAGIQAMTAICIVATLGWVLDFSRTALLDSMPLVEAASYCLIILLGIGMTWSALTGRDCGHDHSGLGHDHHHDHDHDHDHGHHHEHDHDHDHHHDHAAHAGTRRLEFLGAAVVSGLRPCTGALIVLLFALANGIFLVGIFSALAMGAGVAITVSSVGIAVILSRRGMLRITGQGGTTSILARGLSVAGSLLVCLIGVVLLLGIAANWQEAVYSLGRFA